MFAGASGAAPAARDGWEVTGATGLSLADGNADSVAYSLQLLATRITAIDEIHLSGDFFYADDNGVGTTNSLRLGGQYNRLLNDRLYYGFSGSYLTDNIADLDYRFDTNALLGYYLIKNGPTTLAVEAGPGYTWEQQGGLADDYVNLRFAEKFEYSFASRSKFWQSLVFAPEAGDFDNYLLTAEAGIDTLITNQWSLRTFVRYQLDNTPAAGRDKSDTALMLGMAYSLGGFPKPADPGRRTLKAERRASPGAAMGWSTSASLGYSLAAGNSNNRNLTAMLDSAYRTSTDEWFLTAAASHAESDGSTSIDNARAGIAYNHLLGSRYYLGAGAGYQRDKLAGLDYRFTPATYAGIYLLKNKVSTLSFDSGPGYTFEKSGGETDGYLAFNAAERFVYALSPRCTFNQTCVFNTEASDWDNFTLTATAYIDTDITTNLALRVATAYTYDNTPATGRERHDTTLTSGIAVKF